MTDRYQTGIPSLIHVVWLGDDIPVPVTKMLDTCQELNPDFEMRLWRDDDLMWLVNRRSFVSEPTLSGRSNIARFEILHAFGGVYLDADFEVIGALDPIVALGASTGFVAARESRVVFNCAFMAASKGHPLVASLVAGIPASMQDHLGAGSPARTGPLYLTEVILDIVAKGGAITELPSGWVYPYFYDRPDLAKSNVSTETLLRHEWASATHKWGDGSSPTRKLLTVTKLREHGRAIARAVKPAAMRTRLSELPEAHLARHSGYAAAYRLSSWPWLSGKRSRGTTARQAPPHGAADDAGLPTPVRYGLLRSVLGKTRGSATYVEVGLRSEELWHIASRRLDRPGHAIRVTPQSDCQTSKQVSDLASGGHVPAPGIHADSSIRCSRALLLATESSAKGGEIVLTNGTPLRPRTLNLSQSLNLWDAESGTWTLDWLLESFPSVDLLILGDQVDLSYLTPQLERMTTQRRIDTIIIVVDPSSTTRPISQVLEVMRTLHAHGRSIQTLGTTNKQGDNNWQSQLRTAQHPFAIRIALGPPSAAMQ